MDYIKITLDDFDSFFELMEDAFPISERRSYDHAKRLLNRSPYYHVIGTKNQYDKVDSFLAYWEFDHCFFIDHLAVDQSLRGQGRGANLMGHFLQGVNKNVILEVEPPIDEITKRRIGFYERLGFSLNTFNYTQPSMQEGQPPVKLKIMSYRDFISEIEFQSFYQEALKKVYEK